MGGRVDLGLQAVKLSGAVRVFELNVADRPSEPRKVFDPVRVLAKEIVPPLPNHRRIFWK